MRNLVLILAALLPAIAPAALQKGVIEVGAVKGTSVLKDASGRSANLTKGLTFKDGHRIETAAGSTAELLFSNGATILVSAETQIEVKVFTQVASPLIIAGKYKELSAEPSMSIVQIELYRGKIIGEARKLNPSTQFTVKTPVGLTRVRGTVWTDEYTYDDKRLVGTQTTTVVKGEVEVNDLQGSLPAPITGGQEIVIVGPSDKPATEPGTEDTTPGTGGLPPETKTEVKQADPEKIKEVSEEFKGGTTTPPPPSGGGTTEPGTGTGGGGTESGTGGGGTTEPGTEEPKDEPKAPTPPPTTPPPPPRPPVIDDIVEKETQDNLSPSGS